MRQNCNPTPGETYNGPVGTEVPERSCQIVDPEHTFELGHKARQETERFINGNIHDSTKGWPVRSHMPWRSSCLS